MKKIMFIVLLSIVPALVMAQAKQDEQNNVKLSKADNKKASTKSGRLDNPAIRKSKKKMNKQMAEFDAPKYDSRVYQGKPPPQGGNNKDKKDDKPDKKQQKKEL